MTKVIINKYSRDDEYVVKFVGSPIQIKALTYLLDLLKFSVKDRCKTTVTVRATMNQDKTSFFKSLL